MDPATRIQVQNGLRYWAQRFEEQETKALRAKYNLAVYVEAAVVDNWDDAQIGLTDEQCNSLLDWKQDFDAQEANRIAQAQVQIESDVTQRAAELQARKGTTNAARRRAAKNAAR